MRTLTLVMVAAGTISFLPGAENNFLDCPMNPSSAVWEVLVHAISPKRTAVEELVADDFTVTIDHVAQKICGFKHIRWPVSIGILVDNSGSMIEWPSVGGPKQVIEHFLSFSGPQDEYFLAYASDSVILRVPFTSDHSLIKAGLGDQPKGFTSLIDGMYLSLNELRKARNPIRALLVLTDGDDNKSRYGLKDLAAAFSLSPASIFLLTGDDLEWRRRRPSLDVWQRKQLLQFVKNSGGYQVEFSETGKRLTEVAGIAYTIRMPYLLYFSNLVSEKGRRTLKVEADRVRPRPLLFYSDMREYVFDPSRPSVSH